MTLHLGAKADWTAERILIYRCGSLGDTVITLPCFHLVRRAFPSARIRVMTDTPFGSRAVSLESIIENSGLADEVVAHPRGLRDPRRIGHVLAWIRDWRPDALVYLPPFPSLSKVLRDVAFFRLCGNVRMIGVPWTRGLRRHRFDARRRIYETEASRLVRCLSSLGKVDLTDRANWDLHHTEDERRQARAILDQWSSRTFVAVSIGTKLLAQDWGDENWLTVLPAVARLLPGAGLMMVGGELDRDRSERLMATWPGPRLNLCGTTTPRVSALLLRDALFYLGHDSGPMHLAASVGTPCVCVFSRHNLPGWWFPIGEMHRPLYPYLANAMLRLEDTGVSEILPEHVLDAVRTVIASGDAGTPATPLAVKHAT